MKKNILSIEQGHLLIISYLLLVLTGCTSAPPLPTIETPDKWSELVVWRDQKGHRTVAIHTTLMPDGKVLCIGLREEIPEDWKIRPSHLDPSITAEFYRDNITFSLEYTMIPTPLGQEIPSEHNVIIMDNQKLLPERSQNLFCSGHTLLSDGTLFVVGGDDTIYETGIEWATTFDGTKWSRIEQPMVGLGGSGRPLRYYAPATRLANSHILITAGQDLKQARKNLSVEAYNPKSNSWYVLSRHEDSPIEIYNTHYTHVFQLPYKIDIYDVVMIGEYGYPVLFSTFENKWNIVKSQRPSDENPIETPNVGSSTLLLPIRINNGEWGYTNGSFLTVGGEFGTDYEHHADVFDPVKKKWIARIDMIARRHHASSILLPDGRILIVEGFSHINYDPQLQGKAQYIDPAEGFSMKFGQNYYDETRAYHAIALLLPDGRILVGGGWKGTDHGDFKDDESEPPALSNFSFRYYYPDYMSAARPKILNVPEKLKYNETYEMTWESKKPAAEIVLIALGSMTHSIDMNQRYVQLKILKNQKTSTTFQAPPDSMIAPAGHYMIFLIDQDRKPSEAKIIHIS